MKCHYKYVKGAGKVLIPGCMAVAVSGDIERCTCSPSEGAYLSFARESYQNEMRRLKEIIKELRKENDYYAKVLSENEIKNPYRKE